jgi:type II secretory pathway component PulF
VVALTGIGEHTGKMGTMLQQAADHYEQEGKESLEKVVKTFEPVLILTMGLIIGFIVISMLLPVLGISVI